MTTGTQNRLLVVDDEPAMGRGLRRFLRIKGYEVRIAESGEEAIETASEWNPDGILMDIKMPGIDGVEAFRQIRTTCPNAFVIFMTAFSSLIGEARDEGAVEVLTKPLDPDATCELIAKALVTRPVLVVDDDLNFCKSLSRVLKTKGCEVRTATSAKDALAVFEKHPRSVVLLDMRLEETTGLELLRRLKTRNATAPVIQMSGYAEMEHSMNQGLELSATACFTKPLDIDAVWSAIKDAMQHSKKAI